MLKFFRKYQRFFFTVVAVVVIASFVFFGAVSTFTSPQAVADVELTRAVDGTPVMRREVDEIARFLETSSEEIYLIWQGKNPNLLNDGVVTKDFMRTGMGQILTEAYFPGEKLAAKEPRFLHLVAQFLVNAAKIAGERGYQVTKEAARAELLQNAYLAICSVEAGRGYTLQDAHTYMQSQLRALGLTEERGVDVWKKVMLFRRLFNDLKSLSFLDPSIAEDFRRMATESAEIEVHELPESLRFKDPISQQKFLVYLDAVRKEKTSFLPTQFLSAEELEKKYPQLVQKRYQLEWKEVKKEEIAQRVPLRQIWDWQLENGHWELLQKKFPLLAKEKASTREEKFAALEKLKSEERSKLDRFARLHIVDEHPEWIEEAFAHATLHNEEVSIRLKGGELPFAAEIDPTLLISLLDSANVPFKWKSEEGDFHYQFHAVTRPKEKEVLTFVEASRGEALGPLFDKRQEKGAVDVKEKLRAYVEEARNKIVSASQLGEESSPWKLVKYTKRVKRGETFPFSDKEIFSLAPGGYSSVATTPQGNISFCRLIKVEADTAGAHIPAAAQCLLLQQLLPELKEKRAISPITHDKD